LTYLPPTCSITFAYWFSAPTALIAALEEPAAAAEEPPGDVELLAQPARTSASATLASTATRARRGVVHRVTIFISDGPRFDARHGSRHLIVRQRHHNTMMSLIPIPM
jgi:hypothetical protein